MGTPSVIEQGFWTNLARKVTDLVLDDDLSERTAKAPSPRNHRKLGSEGAETYRGKGFVQGGLDAIVTSISVIGDTLGSAIEESLQNVAVSSLESPTASEVRSDVISLATDSSPPSVVKHRGDGKSEEMAAKKGNRNIPCAISRETQLMASRNVATAMATRAKQLQADLKAARKELIELATKCNHLEEANEQLRSNQQSGEGFHEEDMMRKQLEKLHAEKVQMAKEKAELERENELLHQLLLYYEHMYLVEQPSCPQSA